MLKIRDITNETRNETIVHPPVSSTASVTIKKILSYDSHISTAWEINVQY